MMQYRSIETCVLPPGIVNSIDEFKEFMINEVEELLKRTSKYKQENNIEEELPIPIAIYVLFDDFSIQKALLFPRNDLEKRVMVMAVKKKIKLQDYPDKALTSTNPIYGAFASEVFMAMHKLTDEEQELSEEELEKLYHQKGEEATRSSRVLLQFEQPGVTGGYEVKVYSVIDPAILVPEDKESEVLTSGMNGNQTQIPGILNSIFDWTEELELDTIGNKDIKVDTFDLESAVEYVRNVLKDIRIGKEAALKRQDK